LREEIYEETIYSWLMGVLVMGVIVLLIFISFIQSLTGSNTIPQPEWVFYIMIIILIIILNFIRLHIKITPQYVSAAFGIFKYKVLLENIEDFYDDKDPLVRYSGLGIRLNRTQGKWYYGFILVGPRIVLELKESRLGGFVFTTKNPEEVLRILDELNV
jgi:hypothetical protein